MAKSGMKTRGGRPTGKSRRGKIDDKASKARARMAARARRAKFFKENKKRITYIVFGTLGFILFAVFSPVGPNWYYGTLNERKWQSQSDGVIMEGYLGGLMKLASFYSITFRSGKAAEIYDEIGRIYFGFTYSEFSFDPPAARRTREQLELAVARGENSGPPFKVQGSDLQAVGESILYMAEIFQTDGKRGNTRNLIRYLLVEDFFEEHPTVMPSTFMTNARNRAATI